MNYTVKRILEPDYGCEERPADYIRLDKVVLEDINGNEIIKEVKDAELYEKDINEGDIVAFLDEQITKVK